MKKNTCFTNIYEMDHIKYSEIIEVLFKSCSYFDIVDQYEELDSFILPIKSCLIKTRWSKKWEGTKGSKKVKILSFRCNNLSKAFFKKFRCFIDDNNGIRTAYGTKFQFDTIFYKEFQSDKETVFYSITHEGIANIQANLIKIQSKN